MLSMTGPQIIGVSLGLIIGIVSGTAFILLLWVAMTFRSSFLRLVAIIGEILALPTFWFGGAWVQTELLKDVKWQDVLVPYAPSLAFAFVITAIYPWVRIIIRIGDDIIRGPGVGGDRR